MKDHGKAFLELMRPGVSLFFMLISWLLLLISCTLKAINYGVNQAGIWTAQWGKQAMPEKFRPRHDKPEPKTAKSSEFGEDGVNISHMDEAMSKLSGPPENKWIAACQKCRVCASSRFKDQAEASRSAIAHILAKHEGNKEIQVFVGLVGERRPRAAVSLGGMIGGPQSKEEAIIEAQRVIGELEGGHTSGTVGDDGEPDSEESENTEELRNAINKAKKTYLM